VLNITPRPREYLAVKKATKLMDGARAHGRYGHRGATMTLIAYRHGPRATELRAWRGDPVDLGSARWQEIQ
jgi:hypothetical protein